NDSTDEEKPRNRRRVEQGADRSLDKTTNSGDLRSLLKRKTVVGIRSTNCADLRTNINKSKARRIEGVSLKPQTAYLRDQFNSKFDDLRVTNTVGDLRTRLESARAMRIPHLNVIMGGSPPCGDSVRAVKNYRRHATTSQKCISQAEDDHQITFSAIDTRGLHTPHNDQLLIDIRIGDYQVTKVLIDTSSSVDFIFRDTLDKMGIDLQDMKPSSRTLTDLNKASE
ncbi:hypothetical protein N665_0641s0001, partial [Sinapis alba]